MGIGAGIVLVAVGAVLRFAIDPHVLDESIDLHVVGVILMVVGGIGLLLSLLVDEWRTVPGWRRRDTL